MLLAVLDGLQTHSTWLYAAAPAAAALLCFGAQRSNALLQAVLEAVLQDRALASSSQPSRVYFSFGSLLHRAKAAALLVLVAWSLPLSLMLSALVVLRHCWRLLAGGQSELLWQRMRGRLSGERRAVRGTALVSGECNMLPSQECASTDA